MTIYNLRTTELGFRITKFTDDVEVEATYELRSEGQKWLCSCPAGPRPTCKHRKMLLRMQDHVDDGWFYDYERQNWRRPLVIDEASDTPDHSSAPGNGAEPTVSHSITLPEDVNVAEEFAKLEPERMINSTVEAPTRMRR